jgi:hypothetical protein
LVAPPFNLKKNQIKYIMKKTLLIVTLAIGTLASMSFINPTKEAVAVVVTSDFDAGWEDGYCEGWKDVKGSLAYCPYTPYPPYPPYGKDSYRGGYNMGFKAGMRAAYKSQSY